MTSLTKPTSPILAAAGALSGTATATGDGAGRLLVATVSPSDTPPPVAKPATGGARSIPVPGRSASVIETVGVMSDLSAADAVRLVANTAIVARAAAKEITVANVRRNGRPGIMIWIPGWLWDGKTIVAAVDEAREGDR